MFPMYSLPVTLSVIHIIAIAIISNEHYHIECTYLDPSNVEDANNQMVAADVYRIKRDGENSKS